MTSGPYYYYGNFVYIAGKNNYALSSIRRLPCTTSTVDLNSPFLFIVVIIIL